ncbi:MAG: hypothetical protein GY845_39150 [Planctomycetes bacterium]|nr:hypothetical protein [Planctomycetota bacterium]
MKQTKKKIMWLVAFLAIGSIPVFGKPFAVGPYLGQTPPGSTAQVFAPGLICDTRPHQRETWGSFSSDGNTFCFYRRGYAYITENTDQGWTVPKPIKSIPYGTAAYCCLSPDANSIYFVYMYDPSKHYDPYRCQRTSDGWSTPQKLGPPLGSPVWEFGISLAANNSIYFGSGRKGGDGRRCRIWVAPFVDNTWPRADHISLNHPAADPGIAPDESFMVFTAMNLQGGYGQRDLYLSLHLPDGTWSPAQNLGPRINSAYFEYSPRISPDKKYLFFTRANGWGYNSNDDTGDIYWVELKEYLPESYR